MPRYYYFANWKMFQSMDQLKKFVKSYKKNISGSKSLSNCNLAIAPSFEHLYYLQKTLQKTTVSIGAQDCSQFVQGPYTGQVSILSLLEQRVSFCLIGHSEVRQLLGQSNELIALKCKLLLAANISPVICIGESAQQKDDGITLHVLFDQLEPILQVLSLYDGDLSIFIAYEPIYAIGTGVVPELEDLQHVFSFLKNIVNQLPIAKNVMFLYGGSVSSETLPQFENIHEISGFLIGKASIDFQELKKIVESE